MSSVVDGGSGRSQRDLAKRLISLGCDVQLVADMGAPARLRRSLLGHLADASVRYQGRALGTVSAWIRARIGREVRRRTCQGMPYAVTIAPENALGGLIADFDPDVVVASSIDGFSWKKIRNLCTQTDLPTVLYLREEPALEHLKKGRTPDLLLANSISLQASADLLGHPAQHVPSVVEISRPSAPPTGEVLLLVNPIESHGLSVAVALADARPDISIALQESWPLDRDHLRHLERLCGGRPNLELRRFNPDSGMVFCDARALLVPHRVDNRPRVILEAQSHALPVVATDFPGLAEAVGEGGVLVPRGQGDDVWCELLGLLWDDPVSLGRLGALAAAHASRPEVQPEAVAERFWELVDGLIDENHQAGRVGAIRGGRDA